VRTSRYNRRGIENDEDGPPSARVDCEEGDRGENEKRMHVYTL